MRPWSWLGGGGVLRSNQLINMDGYQASSKENQVQIGEMKEMCFLLNSNQKRYSFLLKQPRDRDNVFRD